MYIYIYMYIYVYVYIYIYTYTLVPQHTTECDLLVYAQGALRWKTKTTLKLRPPNGVTEALRCQCMRPSATNA